MWSHKFDYSKRHCWPTLGTGFVDNQGEVCTINHPLQQGNTEFIRWIREFGQLKPGIVTGTPDGTLKLGPAPMTTAPYYMMTCYCEDYGGKVKAFLNVNEGWAIVEVTDEELIPFADAAVNIMRASYAGN